MGLREDANRIIQDAIRQNLPDEAVRRALSGRFPGSGRIFVVAAGKAAWQMARTASEVLGDQITAGVVCTKYGHVMGNIPGMQCFEGGHPVPDENSIRGTEAAIRMVSRLSAEDTVLFLLSGGGSALFEKPLLLLPELSDITDQLLRSGADIIEINSIRKRLSAVKGGRFALLCRPAVIFSVVLSDIPGDPLDMIASGPACPDSSTCAQALAIADRYHLQLSMQARRLLQQETPKQLTGVETVITGSVRGLCSAAAASCAALGYEPVYLTDRLQCEAREAGAFLGAIAATQECIARQGRECTDGTRDLKWIGKAFIAGGETVVHVHGQGMGGRNQELALAAAEQIAGLAGTAVFSVGSDGTDGPTDAAGGYADGATRDRLAAMGISIAEVLQQNDAYHALQKTGGLILTGPTGTNVNDVAVCLIRYNQ